MSQENAEFVKRLAERINAGDFDGMLHLISPGIEYIDAGGYLDLVPGSR